MGSAEKRHPVAAGGAVRTVEGHDDINPTTAARDALSVEVTRIHGVQAALMLLSDSITGEADALNEEFTAALIWTLCRDLDRVIETIEAAP